MELTAAATATATCTAATTTTTTYVHGTFVAFDQLRVASD
jgi:hypothetical protein